MVRLDLNLENRDNYDDFIKLNRKGGIFDRLKKCSENAKSMRFSSKKGKSDYMKECLKKSGAKDKKAIEKKTGVLKSKIKKEQKERTKKYEKKLLKSKAEIPKSSKEMLATQKVMEQGRLANPDLNLGDTPTPKKSNMGKLVLYGGIGIVVLLVGYKIIKG
jgi:hypothetical protein|tara:strand:- start:2131 stop:2613 length:483 start_codon:yes stop_codon:yes gene_type:complete